MTPPDADVTSDLGVALITVAYAGQPVGDDKTMRQESENLKVLVCHPDEIFHQILRRALVDARVDIATTESANVAIRHLELGIFDLLISNERLSDQDIWRLIRVIRSGEFCRPDLPVIVLCPASKVPLLTPVAKDHSAYLADIDDVDQIKKTIDSCRSLRGSPSERILIIDDDEDYATSLKIALQDVYHVDVAPTGESGLKTLVSEQYDLILLDVQLPGISGKEVIEEILRRNPDQPVLVMTNFSTPIRRRHFVLEKGAVDFVSKPESAMQLRALCRQTLTNNAITLTSRQTHDSGEDLEANQHIWAANAHLQSGKASEAARHIQLALALSRRSPPVDDDSWSRIDSTHVKPPSSAPKPDDM